MDELSLAAPAIAVALAIGIAGCRGSRAYDVSQTLVVQRRQILVNQAQEARESQLAAKRELTSAIRTLEALEHDTPAPPGLIRADLETEVETAKEARGALRRDVDSMARAATVLFEDWRAQLVRYADEHERETSRMLLIEAMRSYRGLIDVLRSTEQDLDAVIPLLERQVAMLEHQPPIPRVPARPGIGEVKDQISQVVDSLDSSIEETEKYIDAEVGAV